MNEAAQEVKQLPAIVILYDAEKQSCGVQFDPAVFKTWEFVLAVLEMAKMHAAKLKTNAEDAAKFQAMQQEAITQSIRENIRH